MRSFTLSVILFTLFSCTSETQQTDKPVAQVFEKSLLSSEITAFIPSNLSKDDSLLMAQSYTRNWITKELLLHKAIENLSGEEQNIQKQVEDYRTSLLIHHYKQKLIAQRLQSEIPEEDTEKYYTEHKDNFILPTPIVKAIFFIVPKSASNLADVRKWFKSDKTKDDENLEEYCLTNAKKYDNFNQQWIELKYILNLVPGDVATLEKEIQSMKHIEKEDDENYYFLKIKEIRREQTLAPLEYVKEEIALILKNKKKLLFESELDQQINEEAVRKNYVKIF